MTNAEEILLSHLFTEDQVILRPAWRTHRVSLAGPWRRLALFRLGDVDLLLSKLMRDDPIDQQDARFIMDRAGLTVAHLESALAEARVPPIPELQEQFAAAAKRLLAPFRQDRAAPSRPSVN